MKQSVGVVVVIGGSAVLQRRGLWNSEKEGQESWVNSYQVTCHGGLEEGESFLGALIRELEEECGKDFADTIDVSSAKLIQEAKTEKKEIKTYRIDVSDEQLALLLLHASLDRNCGGFFQVSAEEAKAIKSLKGDTLPDGSEPAKTSPLITPDIFMWGDEREAVQKALGVA